MHIIYKKEGDDYRDLRSGKIVDKRTAKWLDKLFTELPKLLENSDNDEE